MVQRLSPYYASAFRLSVLGPLLMRLPGARLAAVKLVALGLVVGLLPVSAPVVMAQAADGPSVHATPLGALRERVRLDGRVRVIVKLRRDTRFRSTPRARVDSIVSARAAVNNTYTHQPLVALSVDPSDLDALAANRDVAEIYPDSEIPLSLNNTTSVVGAPLVWGSGFTGTGRSVAIIDTGVDSQHPFLAGKVVAEACFSSASPSSRLCPNGATRQFGPGAANPLIPNCLNSFGSNLCNHGTHVAGIAAGANGNDAGFGDFSGVAPGASIVAIQVFHNSFGRPLAYVSDIIAALDWLDSFDGQIGGTNLASVNMSLGSGSYSAPCDYLAYKSPIDRLLEDGVVTVISAGNSRLTGSIGAPGCISSAVTVAASSDTDEPAGFSNISRVVDLWAPGSFVLSSVVGAGFRSYSGTSMAAPHVAGAAAVLEQQGFDGGIDVAAALTASSTTICRNASVADEERCAPRLDLVAAIDGAPKISEEYVSELTSTTAFVGFTSNICGYGDYSYAGGTFTAPRDGVCYKSHGITLGVDTPVLAPDTSYSVQLTLTDPNTSATNVKTITFKTLSPTAPPEITDQAISQVTPTTAFVGFTSNICGYGDYSYPGGSFVAPRDGVCYSQHGITLGIDTPPLTPATDYDIELVLTDPDNGATDIETISFTTPGNTAQPRILRPYTKDITATSAFVGFTSNICGYGDYTLPGGSFVAPRNNICYTDHGITVGVDTPALNPGTTYTVRLILTDPQSGAVASRPITFTTPGSSLAPRIMQPYVTNRTQTTAFVGYTSNICGYGDYKYNGGEFTAPRSYGCYIDHGITLGRDTPELKKGTTYTVEFVLTDPVTNRVGRRKLTFTTVGRGPSSGGSNDDTPIPLTIGVKEEGQYGRNYGSNKHSKRVNFSFTGIDQALFLNYRGYDIDTSGELSVTLNGQPLKRPRVSRNDQLSSVNSIAIPARELAIGDNTLTFSQTDAVDDKYGVTNVRLRKLYGNPIPLTIGTKDTGKYGYAFDGNSSRIGTITYSFQNPGQDLLFSLRGYDIDTNTEAKVYLNRKAIGFLRRGRNNMLAPVSRFVLKASDMDSGENNLYVVQKAPGNRYGSTFAMLRPLVGPTVTVTAGTIDTTLYGYRYPTSSNEYPGALPVNFTGFAADAKIRVVAYDIDTADEVSVWLNNKRIGFLKTTRNNKESTSNFTVSQTDIQASNTLEFRQIKPGNRWGVRNLLVRKN